MTTDVVCVPACCHAVMHKGATWHACGAHVVLLEGHISFSLVFDLILKLVYRFIPKKFLNSFKEGLCFFIFGRIRYA